MLAVLRLIPGCFPGVPHSVYSIYIDLKKMTWSYSRVGLSQQLEILKMINQLTESHLGYTNQGHHCSA